MAGSKTKKAEKNWADVLGIVAMILAILNIINTFLGLIPLIGLPIRIFSTIFGAILLALSIVSCVFCNQGKGKPIVGIVFASIEICIALPLWIIYIPR